MTSLEDAQTRTTRARYDRLAATYDTMQAGLERLGFNAWRRRLWAQVRGPRVLEVGVGTGKNLPFYPAGAEVTAIDLSPRMLAQAQARARREGTKVDLRLMDAQRMDFADGSFDSVVSTFVFCSVPDAIRGLQEVRRVTQPGGQIVLLEHVRSANPLAGALMDLINPIAVLLMGANINRGTVENARAAGLQIESVENLALGGIVKLIVARP